MFTRKTVFVVGAGASAELNLPVGAALMEILRQKLHIRSSNGYRLDSGDRTIISTIEKLREADRSLDLNAYWQAGRSVAAGMGQAISIDNFLDTHNDNREIVRMGKLGIALGILEAEKASHLYHEEGRPATIERASKSWLPIFFQMAHEDVRRTNIGRMFENLTLIVFNYDRCIEHYLVSAVMTHFLVSQPEAEEVVAKLRIVHPYGQVGTLPWGGRQGIRFGSGVDAWSLGGVADGIRTFTEQVEDDDAVRLAARTALSEADAVVYLGFSFGDMNMRYLATGRRKMPVVFGTAFGISEPNRDVIASDIVGSFDAGHVIGGKRPDLVNMKCREFLEAYRLPIKRG